MPDFVRLALGTFTILPVPPPRTVDRTTAGRAMLLAPFVGALLAMVAAGVILFVRLSPLGHRTHIVVTLVASTLAIVTLAVLTRGLHLDGLADTADALGVKGDDDGARERRLAVMRTPEIGAFGAVTLILVLIVQILALTACDLAGRGTVGLVTACVVGRLAVVWACTRLATSARPDGLGATVAGSVPVLAAALLTVAAGLLAVLLGLGDDDGGRRLAAALVIATIGGLAVGALVVLRAVRRFGGITGDVLGATVELTFTAVLLALALLP
jgi:adenosylcobinamide-GDP ribazoletransferase